MVRSMLFAALLAGAAWPVGAGVGSERKAEASSAAGACIAPAAQAAVAQAPPPVLVEGLGFSGIAPDTADAQAKAWFTQGVALIWAFDEAEAVRAFREAQRRDPECALCFWGEAWARGPTINLTERTEELAEARKAADRAAALSGKLGARDKALVDAVRLRASDKDVFRKADYAKAMGALARRYPGDDTVATMAADAMMVVADWERMREGSEQQRLLEDVLARNPEHSGAIHFYIHLTDAIDRQDLAERHADRLGRLAPAASHLVHMPSHTYYGVGRYGDATAVNLAALAAGRRYDDRVKPPPTAYRSGLMGHNAHFAIQGALMRGDGAGARAAAADFRKRFADPNADAGYYPVLRAATYFADGLHGAEADLPDTGRSPFLKAMRAYARGEQLARIGDAAGARRQASAVRAALKLRDFPLIGEGGKAGRTLTQIAALVLDGRAAMIEGRPKPAAKAFRRAMALQLDADFGFDPPAWWYPLRRSLGAAMLAAGETRGARLQLLASLKHWPDDPLALWALSQAEAKRGDMPAAAAALTAAKAAWAGDVTQVLLSRI